MYYYWVEHGKKPSEIYNMDDGEYTLISSFFLYELSVIAKHK